MSCPSSAELEAYRLGFLSGDQVPGVEEHLAACRKCQKVVASQATIAADAGAETPRGDTDAAAFPSGSVQPSTVLPGSTPNVLGSYLLLEELGRGGMGIVYKALHTALKRIVALKTISLPRRCDARAVDRFYREIQALGPLDHPNVVRATDAGEASGIMFLVMDFYEGMTVANLVQRLGPLTTADAAEIARQAALGLDYICHRGLIHRDIKPSNLLLTPTGLVKILDLGLAKLHAAAATGDATGSDSIMGTPDYMAPEQARGDRDVDIRADLYSLGCTLYKLLCGQPPFGSQAYDSAPAKILAHAQVEAPPIQKLRAGIEPGLAAIVKRMLAKDPADRFAGPSGVVEALTPFAKSSDLVAAYAAAEQESPRNYGPIALAQGQGPSRSAARRRAALGVSIVAAVALVIILGGAIALHRSLTATAPGATQPGQATREITWPANYPEVLKSRTLNQTVELLGKSAYQPKPSNPARADANVFAPAGAADLRYQALWARRYCGTGLYQELSTGFLLESHRSPEAAGLTMLILDEGPREGWFELDVELAPGHDVQRRGVFFGLRELPDGQAKCFLMDVEDALVGGDGRATLRQIEFDARSSPSAAEKAAIASLDKPPLCALGFPHVPGSYPLHVSATATGLTLRVSAGEPTTIPMEQLPGDPRGALGIWAWEGRTTFLQVRRTSRQ